MVSAIDATKPADGELPVKADFRGNFQAAKTEIEALQAELAAARGALALAAGQNLFPALGGDNTPAEPANFPAIVLALDAAITAAANSGGNGGPITLANITDLTSPGEAARRAFQRPLPLPAITEDFVFNEAVHGGAFIRLNPNADDVTMTLPSPAALTRPDGYLCSVTAISVQNLARIVGPTDLLRLQNGFFGLDEIVTEIFLGLSQASSFRAVIDIYKVGGVYQLRGQARTDGAADLSFGAPATLSGSVLTNNSLEAGAFPSILDLGGFKRAGGGRDIQETIIGNHSFSQQDAGKTLVHTGNGDATWQVPDLLPATTIDVENEGGAITFDVQGNQPTRGGLVLPADASGTVRWLISGRVVFLGTS